MIYLIDESLIKANQLHAAQVEAQTMMYAARRENQERQSVLARGLRTASVLAIHTVQLLALMVQHDQSRQVLMRSVETATTQHSGRPSAICETMSSPLAFLSMFQLVPFVSFTVRRCSIASSSS